jgi:hypothetical protein
VKFFKHFTDSHRGKSLQQLKRQFGFEGIGRYWTLIELCAEKLEKKRDENLTEEHCVFEFEKTFLMQALGYHNHRHTACYLSALQVIGLCSVSDDGMVYVCSIPKLLESMDRQSKRARPERGQSVPKDKDKDKDKEYIGISANAEPPHKNRLIEIWNQNCGALAKVKKSNASRDRKSKARFGELSESDWIEVVQRIAASDFCNGQNDRGWRASFDFLLRPDTALKVLEGQYANKKLKVVNQFVVEE